MKFRYPALSVMQTPSPEDPIAKRFCDTITSSGEMTFLTVSPSHGAQERDCFNNVRRLCSKLGGEVVFGWAIWIWPGVFIEAEHHAVYRKLGTTQLMDVTPGLPPGVTKRAFLIDPTATYDYENEGFRRDNRRMAIGKDFRIARLFQTAKEINDLLNQFPGIGVITVDAASARQIENLEKENTRLTYELAVKYTGRNSECFCGSGLKFKRCHGK